MPIVEALGRGCKVITYANSNTPAISGGHAQQFAPATVRQRFLDLITQQTLPLC